MKRLMLIGALLIPALANAETVFVQQAKGHQCVGDKFPISAPMEVLYADRECKLPLVHAKDMRAYQVNIRASNEPSRKHPAVAMDGCWGRLAGNSYVVVREDGSQETMPPNAYVTASLSGDGTATVTKSPNQGTAFAQAMEMCP